MTDFSTEVMTFGATFLAGMSLMFAPSVRAQTADQNGQASGQTIVSTAKARIMQSAARLRIVRSDQGTTTARFDTSAMVSEPRRMSCKPSDIRALATRTVEQVKTARERNRAEPACEMLVYDMQ